MISDLAFDVADSLAVPGTDRHGATAKAVQAMIDRYPFATFHILRAEMERCPIVLAGRNV